MSEWVIIKADGTLRGEHCSIELAQAAAEEGDTVMTKEYWEAGGANVFGIVGSKQ